MSQQQSQTSTTSLPLQNRLLVLWTVIVAGLLYSSWPLGYWLNPAVSHRGLASELGALHQPYNWLFNTFDLSAGVLILLAVFLLRRALSHNNSSWIKFALLGFAVFGLLTAIDAGVPINCAPSIQACGGIRTNHLLIVHGIASIGASVGLIFSAFGAWRLTQQSKNRKLDILLYGILAGWALFGIASLVFFFVPGPGYLAQHYFITLCSLWTILLPYILLRAAHTRKLAD